MSKMYSGSGKKDFQKQWATMAAKVSGKEEMGKPKSNSIFSAATSLRSKQAAKKMDLPKALSAMGFSNTRMLSQAEGHDPRVELANALHRRMLEIEEKKRRVAEKSKGMSQKYIEEQEEKCRDETRRVHEAYQYLSKKYLQKIKKDSDEAEDTGISAMAAAMPSASSGTSWLDTIKRYDEDDDVFLKQDAIEAAAEAGEEKSEGQ